MKTRPFLFRVGICLLLSLVPLTDLENRIYSARMRLRGLLERSPELVIVDVDPSDFRYEQRLNTLEPMLMLSFDGTPNGLESDSDGVVRRASRATGGRLSLAFAARLRLKGGSDVGERLPDPHLINFLGPQGTVPRCHLFNLLSGTGTGACASLKDRIALINEDSVHGSIVRTPVGEMSVEEAIANDIHTLVHGGPIRTAPWPVQGILLLGMVLIAAYYISHFPVILSSIAITGTALAIIGVLFQLFFQLFGLYVPSANLVAALFVTYLVFTGYRLVLQEHLQWRSLQEAQHLRELDRMKTNFLSMVSHDLKTPIAKIQAVVDRLRRELPAAHESLDSLDKSNQELKHAIDRMLSLSRIESQNVILNIRSSDINVIIQSVLKRLAPLAAQKEITIEERLDPLFLIECDEDLIRQVLTNLIDNAVKYSPASSRIVVRSHEEGAFVRVEVEDAGPGIPKDQLPLMFRKFSRFLSAAGPAQVKGTGLGLYLSKYFIELHGGTIRVKSVEGKGTTFSFTLPLQGAENETILG